MPEKPLPPYSEHHVVRMVSGPCAGCGGYIHENLHLTRHVVEGLYGLESFTRLWHPGCCPCGKAGAA